MNNPYAAPQTELTAQNGGEQGAVGGFYVVSRRKFWILSIATLGLYVIAWGYKSWNALRLSRGLKIWPVARAIFIVFFIHALMKIVAETALAAGRDRPISYKRLANITVVVLIVNYIVDRLSAKNIGYPIVDIISIGMLFVVAPVMWNMQSAINYVAGDESGGANDALSTTNWVWIVIGILLWSLAIYGLIPGPVEA